MRRARNILTILGVVIAVGNVRAQDPHFTLSPIIPAWYNPATAGEGIEHIRATALYRNQWSSVTSPFLTEALFFDKQVEPVGFGLAIVNNTAGPSGFRQLFFNGQIAYRLRLGEHCVGTGLQVGFIQKSFDPSRMTFDDQYTPDQGFNPAMPTSETFSFIKVTRPDAGLGVYWSHGEIKTNRFRPFAGISMQHINRAKEVFMEEYNLIRRKTVIHAGADIRLKNGIIITPQSMIARQQPAREWLSSASVQVPLENKNMVLGGLHYRYGDAVALSAGYRLNSLRFVMSYDVNISGATGGPGGFEMALTWIPAERKKRKPEEVQMEDEIGSPAGDMVTKKQTAEHIAVSGEVDEKKILSKDIQDSASDTSLVKTVASQLLPDADQDGIPDKHDRCPFMKGGALTGGCPDTDHDGVTDLEDDCPLTAGTPEHFGCPPASEDEGSRYSAQSMGNIEFPSGSTEVHGLHTLDIIEPALDELLADTALTLVITGHTDNEGDATLNMMLSRSRTEAVKSIFIRKGLAESRILTVAYGENRPIRENNTQEGRRHNRRAEVHLMKDSRP